MALRNSDVLRTPPWLRVEATFDDRAMDYKVDVGIKCRDGWAHLVSMDTPIGFGNGDTLDISKAQAYERAHNFITRKLAIETLENT